MNSEPSLLDASPTTSTPRKTAAPPTITLLLPVLNEIDGLRETLPFIDRGLVTEILMVDGGSTDGSVEFAQAQGVQVVQQRRPGLAWAVYDALVRLETDYVIEFSPDGNCPVDVLAELVRKLGEGYDLVVVSRYLPPARSEDDNIVTAFGNWMFTRMVRLLGKEPITDALTIYRGFRRNIIFAHDFHRYIAGPVFEPLVTAICTLHGKKMCEIPGDEPRRVGGDSKMRPLYNGSCILVMIARLYLKKFLGVTL